MTRPLALYPLLLLHFLLGLFALIGGWGLLSDPVGLGVNAGWLEHSPFSGYLIPGLFLFVVNGIFPWFIVLGLWQKPSWRWANALNIYPDRHWAWTYSLFMGLIIIGWIAVQMIWVPSFWLQPVVIGMGLFLLIFTLWPGVMRHFQIAV